MQLEVGKKCRTRDGRIIVEVLEMSTDPLMRHYPAIVKVLSNTFERIIVKGDIKAYMLNGRYMREMKSYIDLVEEVI